MVVLVSALVLAASIAATGVEPPALPPLAPVTYAPLERDRSSDWNTGPQPSRLPLLRVSPGLALRLAGPGTTAGFSLDVLAGGRISLQHGSTQTILAHVREPPARAPRSGAREPELDDAVDGEAWLEPEVDVG